MDYEQSEPFPKSGDASARRVGSTRRSFNAKPDPVPADWFVAMVAQPRTYDNEDKENYEKQ